MELSRSRPYGAEGRKPTHDFLSLYNHSTTQQDARPPCQGNYLKTHDFLQVGNKGCAKEEMITPPPGEKPPPVEHVLPGGIGTYSISHINTYMSPIIRAPKPEGTAVMSISDRNDESLFCGSYGVSGFTLWDESAANKGKTGKENSIGNNHPARVFDAAAGRAGQWGSSSTERPYSQSSSNNHRRNFSSLSSSQPSGQRSQSFLDMIKSAKGSTSHEDELEEEEHFALKKEISSATTITPNELRVKVDGKSSDPKANTPRSKHSATEQRRRSKINDRFQMLRGLIPHGDQKRDKASFLLEVIEYIQFLQDKVQKYEGPYQGWNDEQSKLIPWRSPQGMNSGPGPGALVFATKLDEKPLTVSPVVAGNAPNLIVESDTSTATITNKGMTFPLSLQPNFFTPVRNGSGAVHQAPLRLQSDVEHASSQPQSRSCTTVDGAVSGDKLKEEDLTIEGGTVGISSAYSQGLLTTLTQALQSSGVDLSRASLSVQIELGKRAKSRATATTSVAKDDEISPSNNGVKHSRAPSADDSDQVQKKLKASKN